MQIRKWPCGRQAARQLAAALLCPLAVRAPGSLALGTAALSHVFEHLGGSPALGPLVPIADTPRSIEFILI